MIDAMETIARDYIRYKKIIQTIKKPGKWQRANNSPTTGVL